MRTANRTNLLETIPQLHRWRVIALHGGPCPVAGEGRPIDGEDLVGQVGLLPLSVERTGRHRRAGECQGSSSTQLTPSPTSGVIVAWLHGICTLQLWCINSRSATTTT